MTSRNLTGFCLKGNLKNVMSFLKTRGLFYKVGILYLCKYGSGAAIVSVLFNFTYIRFLSSNAFSKSFFKYASTKVNPNTGFRHLKERHIFYQLFEKFLHFFFSSCPRQQSENGVGSGNILGPTTTTTATTTTSSTSKAIWIHTTCLKWVAAAQAAATYTLHFSSLSLWRRLWRVTWDDKWISNDE